MTTIEQLIGDLLLRNNCVIIPSFGGFVAKRASARIDYTTGKMFPPSKSLLFNKQLINNDGLLINEYAQNQNITFDASSNTVAGKVAEWNKTLASGGRVELDRIGFLYNDSENNLCFEQDRFFNLLLDSLGLEQIHFLTEEDVKIVESKIAHTTKIIPIVASEQKVIVENQEQEKIKVIEHPVLKSKNVNVWKYLAAACFLPIAFYSFWIPMKTDVLESGVISIRDFNPFNNQQESAYNRIPVTISEETLEGDGTLSEKVENLPAEVDVYTYKFDDALYIPVKLKEELPEVSTNFPLTDNAVFKANTMHFIVGCFGDASNATNLVSKLQAEGFDASIVDVNNGLHRVSAGGAVSLEALAQIKDAALTSGLNGWTLK